MHSNAHRHIGIALLGCSFVLFTLWALPYLGGGDGFSLSASASQELTLAPEHMQIENQLRALQAQYKTKDAEAGVRQLELDVLDTVSHLFQDENPQGELLRGDAAYLVAIYATALGKPCGTNDVSKTLCVRPAGGATSQPDLRGAREYSQSLKVQPFTDLKKEDWYAIYVTMLSGLHILDTDAIFEGDKPVTSTDMGRWLSRAEGSVDRTTSKAGATLTKRQGVDMLTERLTTHFAARAARR